MLKNIVFDLGRVLLDFDHAFSFAEWERLGAKFDRNNFYREFLIDEYERGDITGEEFLCLLQKSFPPGVGLDVIRTGWTDIFSPITEMIELAGLLRRNHKVFILSNTCDLHWDVVEERYGMSGIVDGAVTSFEARARKPELEIYRFTEKKFGLVPGETVFIDDIEANAHGAVAAGWRGIHHLEPKKTKEQLRAFGAEW